MKKIVLSLLLFFIIQHSFSQAINESANWPNTSWTVTGDFNTAVLDNAGNPVVDANFSYDDTDAGDTTPIEDDLAAESPIIDITAASTSGESFLSLNSTYTQGRYDVETLTLQYWDADSNTWENWGNDFVTTTTGDPDFDFCNAQFVPFQSLQLDISSFTATQLAGFRYRIAFKDNDPSGFGGGFCISSPTITSQATVICLDPTNFVASNATINSIDLNWNAGGAETAWEITIQSPGTGVPTTNGLPVSTNPFTATGLNDSTNYEVYIRANCLTDGFSDWIGPILFTTLRTPPLEPVGVTCTTGTSSEIFMEDFGEIEQIAPLGWTGTGFNGGVDPPEELGKWSITIAGTNTSGTGPLASWDGNSGVHLEYEASGNSTNIDSAITPAIDLTAAIDGAELSFYMHAYGSAIGLLNIGVGTAATGPFTNAFSWNKQLQINDADAWVPVGVNLDAYIGQIVYIEFSYGADGSDDTGDLSIDEIKVESCGSFCIAPSDVIISNVTETAADIAWTSNGTESNWEYIVQPVGTGIPTNNGTAVTVTNANVTPLIPATDYEVYVRANCLADGFSSWYGPIPFETLKIPPPVPIGVNCTSGGNPLDLFAEDFGLIQNTAPAGWTGTNFEGNLINGDWRITEANSNTNETGPLNSWDSNPGVHLEYESSGNTSSKASAITPAIDLTAAIDSAELSFYMHAFGATMGTFTVSSAINPTGPFTTLFTWNGDLQDMEEDAWIPVGVDLTNDIGKVIYLEFAHTGSGIADKGDFAIDQIKIETCDPPACPGPTDLTVSNETTTTADASWTPGGSETAWEYVVQPEGTGVPTANGTATTVPNVSITGLDPITTYEIYVRADCLADGFSIWVGPITFITSNPPPPPPVGVSCASGSASLAFEEGFGLQPNIVPSGWTGTFLGNSNNGDWRITNPGTNTSDTGPLNSWDNNPGVHLEYEASGSATSIASAITPAINLTAATDGAELSFYMHAFGEGIGLLNVGVATSASGPFTTVYSWSKQFQTTDAQAWAPIGVNLDAYLGQTVFIEFAYNGNGGDEGSKGDIAIDEIKVESCGSFCLEPKNLTATNITQNGVDVSWSAGSTETAWEYVVQPAGTGLPITNGVATTTTTNAVTGLTNSTAYEVYVRANCLADGFSNWVGPINFTTLALPPPPPNGVDCTTGNSARTLFTETFGTVEKIAPPGWTGTGFNGHITTGNWRITEPGENSPNTGPLNSWDGNAGVHLEYEASNNQTNIASAISPIINMTSATDSAELSFYLHAYGASTGLLNIGVSNSATGPFTNVFTWNGQLQATDADNWVPVGVNLDDYLGQSIYIEFAYGGDGSNIFGDLAIDQIKIDACASIIVCEPPTNIVTSNITATSLDIAWTPGGTETQWEYIVLPAGTTPPANGTIVNTPNASVTGLIPGTNYDIFVLANCSATSSSAWAGPVTFTTIDDGSCIVPMANVIDDIVRCDEGDDGFEPFNLAAQRPAILGTQNPSDFIVTFHETLLEAQTRLNPLTPSLFAANGKEIFVRVEDINNPNCANSSTKFSLFISGTPPDVSSPGDMELCDDDTRDGNTSFDLEFNTPIILGALNPSEYSVTYHTSQTEAETATNALTSPYTNISSPQRIYSRVEAIGTTDCFEVVDFNLVVNDVPLTTFDPDIKYEVCPNETSAINITAIANNYSEDEVAIQWLFEGVNIPDADGLELLNIGEEGTYTINVTFKGTRCSSQTDVIVTELSTCGIAQGISPNGDDLNENFDLSGFDVQSLEIFNRYGILVYSKNDYKNEWKGQSNDGDELPVGTYYYVMRYKGDQVRSAWIYINK